MSADIYYRFAVSCQLLSKRCWVNHRPLYFYREFNRLQYADHYSKIINKIVCSGQFYNKPPPASGFIHNYIGTVRLLQAIQSNLILKRSVGNQTPYQHFLFKNYKYPAFCKHIRSSVLSFSPFLNRS